MINHKDHDHPNTAAARALCRRQSIPTVQTIQTWEKNSITKIKKNLTTDPWRPEPTKPKTNGKIKLTDEELLARNRARFTSTPEPTPAQREEALADVTILVGVVKGSKSVHAVLLNRSSHESDVLSCTRRASTAVISRAGTRSDVTCKNCARILNIAAEND